MYRLKLTSEDFDTIGFVGNRYAWSDVLWKVCHVGINRLQEHEAWQLREAFESDTEGNHSMFPMLSRDSDLYRKLIEFYCSIV